MDTRDVLFRREGALGRITLNRLGALNALTLPMVEAMLERLRAWADDPAVEAVLIDAVPGRAFCAGGDIRALYESGREGGAYARTFFRTEYRLNAATRRFPKPYVAAIDGLTMGGGAGVTVHGRFRAVSENATFAMPETAIGLIPDIGASYFLSRLAGEMGMYLALTGSHLTAADMIYAGIATHFVAADHQIQIRERLAQGASVEAVLSALSSNSGPAPLAEHRKAIDRAFAQASVEAILAALAKEGRWGDEVSRALLSRSPTSLKVTFREIRQGAALDFKACQRMEYGISSRMVESHDFLEGVRAAVIDKDQAPRWLPADLTDVTDSAVARYFSQLEDDFTF